jgi:hypothetical protein
LRVQTRDVDCSGLAASPEDGELVGQDGGSPAKVYSGATEAAITATDAEASSLTMVWSSAQSSDRQALGDTRVATLAHGGVDVDCTMYIAANTSAALSAAANFPLGGLVTAQINTAMAVEGSATRLLLAPMAEGHAGWCLGYVTRTSASNPAADRAIGVYLYDKPRKVTNGAAS